MERENILNRLAEDFPNNAFEIVTKEDGTTLLHCNGTPISIKWDSEAATVMQANFAKDFETEFYNALYKVIKSSLKIEE